MTAIPKLAALFETTLANKITSSATTMTLVTGTDDAGTTLSGIYGFVIDEGTASEEFVLGTVAGTAVTGMSRGLDPQTATTEVAALKKEHRRGATVKISDYPILGYIRNILAGESGWTLPALLKYASGIVPVSGDDIADKAYVDSVVAGIATTVNLLVPGTAGETVAAGNLIYFDDTDNEWKKCDADTAATVENALLGIAQGAGTDGNSINGGVLLRGLDANQSGLTAGAIYYASNTAGGISSSAGTQEVTVGFSYSTTQLYFNPRFNQQLTEDQQDALAATTTPASGNKFITQKDLQIGAEKYAASAAGTDTYAITLSPAPAAYVNGMVVNFKADVANTGAATLNVNSLGAVDITKYHDVALATGDIEANQIVTVIYNSSTAKFQMVSQIAQAPATTYKNGQTTKSDGDADAATTVIAHGLGATPKRVRIRCRLTANSSQYGSDGLYDSTSQNMEYFVSAVTAFSGQVSSKIAQLHKDDSNKQVGTLTVDATNLTITWAKTGTPNIGTYNITWEAET